MTYLIREISSEYVQHIENKERLLSNASNCARNFVF